MKRIPFSYYLCLGALALALSPSAVRASIERRPASPYIESYATTVRRVAPTVVNVYAKRHVKEFVSPFSSLFQNPFFKQFNALPGLGVPRERVESSLGSGVVLDAKRGLVVTNSHVIRGSQDLTVALRDGRDVRAKVILNDPKVDLAILKIPAKNLVEMRLHNSNDVEVGDVVLAVGDPFGVGQTVTMGIISALARTQIRVSDYRFFIQTDASVNPGNSGGALVTTDGYLVGINSAILSKGGGSVGIGFAIPSNIVRVALENAKAGHKTIEWPWVGASFVATSPAGSAEAGSKTLKGACVEDIFKKGPLYRVGVRKGDCIVVVGSHNVQDAQSFLYYLVTRGIGRGIDLVYKHGGVTRRARLKIVSAPEMPAADAQLLKGAHPLEGLEVENISPYVAQNLTLPISALRSGGVVVLGVRKGSIGAELGIRVGDIIFAINSVQITSVAQLQKILMSPKKASWELDMMRKGRAYTINFRAP